MRFVLNKPFQSEKPDVEVDAGLPAGLYRFQLAVVSEHGQQSEPCEILITILPAEHEVQPAPAALPRPRAARPVRKPRRPA